MKKMLPALLLILSLMVCAALAEAPAECVSGDYTYVVRADGTAMIVKYAGREENLTIPETLDGLTVTALGDRAFGYASDTVTVAIPDCVTEVGVNPFFVCVSLREIVVSPAHPTLKCVGGALFDKTSARLVSFCGGVAAGDYTVPDGTKSIGADAFARNHTLTGVTLPDSLLALEDGAFNTCGKLTAVTIPDSVAEMGSNPFVQCNRLTEVRVSAAHPAFESVGGALIGKADRRLICFPGGLAVTRYDIPEGVAVIGADAFNACKNLQEVAIPASVTVIEERAFRYCNQLTAAVLPDALTLIGSEAFAYCTRLENIRIPHGVTTIGDRAWFKCLQLFALDVPDSVTTIGEGAFASCVKLERIAIPASVTAIGEGAFDLAPSVVITGEAGSVAAQYAAANGIPFAAK